MSDELLERVNERFANCGERHGRRWLDVVREVVNEHDDAEMQQAAAAPDNTSKPDRWREPLSNDHRNKMTAAERARPRGLQPLPTALRFRKVPLT